MVSLGWRSMSDIIDLLCCKYVFSLSSENIRKHRRLEFCDLFQTIQFTVQRFLANLRDLKTYEFHRCIAEYLVCAPFELFLPETGEVCKNTTHFLAMFFESNICKNLWCVASQHAEKKGRITRNIDRMKMGWKWGTHRSISYTFRITLNRGNISISQKLRHSLSIRQIFGIFKMVKISTFQDIFKKTFTR